MLRATCLNLQRMDTDRRVRGRTGSFVRPKWIPRMANRNGMVHDEAPASLTNWGFLSESTCRSENSHADMTIAGAPTNSFNEYN